ncbi:MAG: D-alanyl-D-alanine carboxypeptidase [Clostridia bacterium]|nr:D-alanyl-D-alanine carboxypeptidase [Clostridia bacterium]
MKKLSGIFCAAVLTLCLCCQAFAYEGLFPVQAIGDAVAVSADALAAMQDTAMKVDVNAESALLMEAATGEILMAKNERARRYPASVTKIMSMLLVCEALDAGKISLTDTVATTEEAASKGGSQIWLKVGEVMTVDELLKATAVYSANDACTLLGEYVAGSDEGFVKMMNDRAAQLGMTDTHFDNCTGLDDTTQTHLTTAYDIALMSRELLKHDIIKNYTTIYMDSLRDGATQLVNTNKLVRTYKGITGLKTGTTDKAGCCIAATAERDGLSLIAVVLGAENSNARFNGAKALLDWGFANYECFTPQLSADELTDVKVLCGKLDRITPMPETFGAVLVEKGQGAAVQKEILISEDVEAPVEKGQTLGTVRFTLDGEVLCTYRLLAPEAIERLTFFDYIVKMFTNM